ncbi:MAG: hypothetical protein AB7I37_21315 [Pirellulales bacterium]
MSDPNNAPESDPQRFTHEPEGGLTAGGRAKYSHSHTETRRSWRAFFIGLTVTLILAAIACFFHPLIGVVIAVIGFLLSLALPSVFTRHTDTHHFGED